jgi:integrase
MGRRHLANERFTTKGDALGYLSDVETKIHRGVWVDPSAGRLQVSELAKLWMASNPTKRGTTATRDEIAIRVHITPAVGTERIDRIAPADVQAVVNSWLAIHAPRTVRRNYGVLRAIFAYAVANDWLARSPCRNVKLPAITATRRHDLAADDVVEIASHVTERYRPMVWLGAVLGLRWSEVIGLRVGRLDLPAGSLTVAEAITRGSGGHLISGPPKSAAGRRTLTVPDPLVEMMEAHLSQNGLTGSDPASLVFTDDRGGPVRYENWRRRVWLPAATAAGVKGAGFHDLRRLAATSLVVGGVDVKTAQNRLGHSDPRLTLAVYASAPVAADRAAAETLARQFFPGSPAADGG